MNKLIDWLDDKKIAVVALTGLIFSIIPFFYLAGYVRPAGDDLGYGRFTHAAWLDTGSLWEVFKAAIHTAEVSYRTVGGEWMAYFFNALMPEVFAPYAFWITPYIFIFINLVGTAVFFRYFLVKVLKINWEYAAIIYAVYSFFMLQYIPSYNIGMYWFSGAFHYIVPHIIFLLSLIFIHRFMTDGLKRYLVLFSFCGLVIGGVSIHYSMMLVMAYTILIVLLFRRNKAILWLGIPIGLCLAGFLIYTASPGHNIRASAGFSLSMKDLLRAVGRSLAQELAAPFEYIANNPLLIVLFVFAIVFGFSGLLRSVKEEKCLFQFRYPLFYIILTYLINSAMNAPRIYTVEFLGVTDASRGPLVVEWLVFLLTWLSAILYLEGFIILKLRKKYGQAAYSGPVINVMEEKHFRGRVVFPVMILCLFLVICWRSAAKDSFVYQAYVYVKSGEAANYQEQISEYMELLLDDEVEEVYLKPINDVQGPLLHWAVMEDENNYVNWVYKEFYRKKKVVIESTE